MINKEEGEKSFYTYFLFYIITGYLIKATRMYLLRLLANMFDMDFEERL